MYGKPANIEGTIRSPSTPYICRLLVIPCYTLLYLLYYYMASDKSGDLLPGSHLGVGLLSVGDYGTNAIPIYLHGET